MNSSAASVNCGAQAVLFKKPLPGLYTPVIIKDVPTTDTAIYTVTTPGKYAIRYPTSCIHNTTGSSITHYTSIKRASDPAPFVLRAITTAANTQSAWNPPTWLLEGDTLYIRASAAGLNFFGGFVERPVVGF
jgi:hypothetical protein